jgi:putative (di)nucleoside polyphosphate hydrolase
MIPKMPALGRDPRVGTGFRKRSCRNSNRADHNGNLIDMSRYEDLPYRPCVAMMVLNRAGNVFIGRRTEGPEQVDPTHVWQMPQGGVDPGEEPYPAALRELYEETNIRSVERLGEIADWLSYDIPREIVGQAWKGKYRGQTQKWFALRFTGDDSEIDTLHPAGGHHVPEFVEWRWEPMQNLPDLIVPFKRRIYERVVKEFAHLARN